MAKRFKLPTIKWNELFERVPEHQKETLKAFKKNFERNFM